MAGNSTSHAITDFFIQLGFDPKAVTSGLNKLEKDFEKFSKKLKLQHKVDFNVKHASVRANNELKAHNKNAANKLVELSKKEVEIVRAKQRTIEDIVSKSESAMSERERKDLADLNKQASRDRTNKKADKIAPDNVKRSKEEIANEKELLKLNRQRVAEQKNLDMLKAKREGLSYDVKRSGDVMQDRLTGSGTRSIDENLARSKEYNNILKEQRRLLKAISNAKTPAQFKQLSTDMKRLKHAQSDVIAADRRMRQSMMQTSFVVKALRRSVQNMAFSYLSLYAVMRTGQRTLQTGMDIQRSKVALLMGSGDAKTAATNYKFLTDTAYKYGASLESMTKSYGKIAAGGRSAGLTDGQIKDSFVELNDVAVAYSLTQEEMKGIYKAMTDSLSKGTLMSEELRGQLGDQLPEAVGAMARAMDVSTEKLSKMMKTGEIVASDAIPKLTKEMQRMAVESGALAKGMNLSSMEMDRLRTKTSLLVGEMFDAGLDEGLGDFFQLTRTALTETAPLFRALGKILGMLLKVSGTMVLMVKQTFRPFYIILEMLADSFNLAEGNLSLLTRGFYYLALGITYPFELLEKMNDWSEKKKGIWGFGSAALGVGLFAGKAFLLNKLLSKIFGAGRMARFLSGWGLIANVAKAAWYPFAKLGQVIGWLFTTKIGDGIASLVTRLPKLVRGFIFMLRAGFTLISKHPLIAALVGLAGFIAAPFQDKTKDLAARYQEDGSGKVMSWAKAIGVAGAENTAYGFTGGLYSPEWATKAGRGDNRTSNVTNNINVNGADIGEVKRVILPVVDGKIKNANTGLLSTGLSAQE